MKAKLKLGMVIGVILTLAVVGATTAIATTFKTWRTENGMVIQRAGDTFLEQGHSRVIPSPALLKLITDTDSAGNLDLTNDPLIVDVRSKADYETCHIPGAIWIADFNKMAEETSLDSLDKALAAHIKKTGSDDIVVYCYTGHTAGLVTGALGTIGYDIKNLRFGYNVGWMGNKDKVSGINASAGPCEPAPAQ